MSQDEETAGLEGADVGKLNSWSLKIMRRP